MSPHDELLRLANLQVEDQLSEQDEQRLAALFAGDESLLSVYAEFICLHGQLYWDAGLSAASLKPVELSTSSERFAGDDHPSSQRSGTRNRRISSRHVAAVLATLVTLVAGWFFATHPDDGNNIVDQPQPGPNHFVPEEPTTIVADNDGVRQPELKPLELKNGGSKPVLSPAAEVEVAVVSPDVGDRLPDDFDNQTVVDRIDKLLLASWKDQGVEPSKPAEDTEWIRRVYLTLMGRVPTLNETETYLSSRSPRKRLAVIDQVVSSPDLAAHFSVVWTNLLVGRTKRSGVNREALTDFLFRQFRNNKPWIDTVDELITATGRSDQNGATNFLLAHLNNEATPATAVTARLFLGEHVNCVQCHDSPFANGARQQDYWALNAFFKDTNRVTVPIANASQNGSMADVPWQLVDRPRDDRMTYYETRSGLEKAVLPAYDGHTMSKDSLENRRQELARLLATDSDAKVARAMVNRMWSHFFGYGFTNPIDDMGPHVPVSHPELLDLLTEAFVKSDYDLQRLMKWIATSRAWQLSSEAVAANVPPGDHAASGDATVANVLPLDDPASGGVPLFSRVYIRRMTPEQVYESIRVAIQSAAGLPVNSGDTHSRHRRDWVRQFAQAYDTDENDESLNFEGTIAQAMVMMNGVEVDDAIHQATRAIMGDSGRRQVSGNEALNKVALAMLTRKPTSREQAGFRKRYLELTQQGTVDTPMVAAVEDVMWAYLNSSEFVLVH